uniref:G protein gamma domain-containing protein n=1 Tax=Ciona intestinalis TaxID=7719 RepID=H2XP47_CIOIN
MNSQLSCNLESARKLVDELKYHTNISRLPVSQAATELLNYVLENQGRDFLLVKPPDNPFKPKSSCMFL